MTILHAGEIGRLNSESSVIGTDDIPVVRNGILTKLSANALLSTPYTTQRYFETVTLTSTANVISWDLDTAQNARYTATENVTLQNPTNMKDGAIYNFTFIQHASAAKTLAFGSAYERSDELPTADDIAVLGGTYMFTWQSNGTQMILRGFTPDAVV